jgi:hypothetical protein
MVCNWLQYSLLHTDEVFMSVKTPKFKYVGNGFHLVAEIIYNLLADAGDAGLNLDQIVQGVGKNKAHVASVMGYMTNNKYVVKHKKHKHWFLPVEELDAISKTKIQTLKDFVLSNKEPKVPAIPSVGNSPRTDEQIVADFVGLVLRKLSCKCSS